MSFAKAVAAAAVAALLLASGPAVAQTPPPAPEPVRPIRATKIVLVGDSTTAVAGGWGPSFCAYHVTSFTACINLARGGRSSGNYRAEGSWALAMNELATPGYVQTYVLIQFGHNDQPGKPGRSTDLATQFPANMKRYVEEARSVGAIPILVTPLTRRQFRNGQLEQDLAPWAEAVRKVASETGTPLIDLNADSTAAVQAMGPVAAMRFAQTAPSAQVLAAGRTGTTIASDTGAPPAPPAPPRAPDAFATRTASFDYTHLGREGADYFAEMVTRALARAEPRLRGVLLP
jgi:lysophospholipase L1-like esterase